MGNSLIAKDKDDNETRRDEISRLPDDILHRILYFNGMKQAVQTSVLSKRWRNVWRCMPQLNFDVSEFLYKRNPNKNLFDFAECAVVQCWSHEYCQVRKIRFVTLNDLGRRALIRSWGLLNLWAKKVEAVVVGLEEIELLCKRRHQPESELPQALRFFMYPWTLRKFVTRSLELWNHKDCEQRDLEIVEEQGYQLENVLIANCTYKSIRISQNELKVLKLWCCGTLNCHIRVFTPNLRLLDCRQIPSANLYMENSADSILDAVLDFLICPADRKVGNVIKMVDALHNVKSLTLSTSIIKCLNMHRDVFEYHPIFHNLKLVVLLFETSNHPIAIKRHLLQRWPNLETLEIKGKNMDHLPFPLNEAEELEMISALIRQAKAQGYDVSRLLAKISGGSDDVVASGGGGEMEGTGSPVGIFCNVGTEGVNLENSPHSILDSVHDFTICPEVGKVDDVIKMVDALHNVKSLTLSSSIIKCLTMLRDVFDYRPTFHNLKHVVLVFETLNEPLAIKRDLLQRWPNLETLEIKECGRRTIITNSLAVLQNALPNKVSGGGPLFPMLAVGVVGAGLLLYLEFRHERRGSMWRSLVSRVFTEAVGRCRSS